jgi:hypothetical protein
LILPEIEMRSALHFREGAFLSKDYLNFLRTSKHRPEITPKAHRRVPVHATRAAQQLENRFNGLHYPLVVIQDAADLTEAALSHANCLKTRRLPAVGCTPYSGLDNHANSQ